MRYYHSPNIGDVIYALPVIRHLGGGSLYLDPGADEAYRETFLQSLSLFNRQPYITDCRLYGGEGWDRNLDTFRNVLDFRDRPCTTLVDAHFRGMGLVQPETITPWLAAGITGQKYPVVLHRSARYQGEVDYTFLHQIRRGDLFVVGYAEETAHFREVLGATWLPTATLDHLAAIINSAGIFIGNQSAPLAIAVGLGKPRLTEECPWWPNCTYGGSNECVLNMDAGRNWECLRRLGYEPVPCVSKGG